MGAQHEDLRDGPVAASASLAEAWRTRVRRQPHAKGLAYFDHSMTVGDLDEASDALAIALRARGTRRGDTVGIYLQNIPQYALAFLALWKLGAIAVVLNPMYRSSELRRIVDDAGLIGLICTDTDAMETERTLHGSSVRWIVTTSPRDYQSRDDYRVFGGIEPVPGMSETDLKTLIETHRGGRLEPVDVDGDEVALLTYTSGTSGPPKGAMNTHQNILAATASFASCVDLRPGDAVFAMAPMFHITGAVINATIALLHDSVLVMSNRFHPGVAIDTFVEHDVTFTIGSITAFNAIYQLPSAARHHFSSVKALYSGGAPIPPAIVERFEARFGLYIHNAYGMTETTAAIAAVPLSDRAPVEPSSGALSVGRPLPRTEVKVVDTAGHEVPRGCQGELVIRSPQVIPGYWREAEATAATIRQGWLHTGDGAIVDDEGWIYLVDRLKDQINTSGYKVWPREVEDVLAMHSSVLEVAVVGQPDEYRGEAVIAYVSLREGGAPTSGAQLIAFTRERLAAYKCPREVHIVSEIPKTQTGKIRRNVLRETGS